MRALAAALGLALGVAACGSGTPSTRPNASAGVSVLPPLPRAADPALLRGPWSPVPFRPNPSIVAAADRECRSALRQLPPQVQIVVSDARGDGVLQLWYAAPNGDRAECHDLTIGPDGSIGTPGGGGTTVNPPPAPPMRQGEVRVTDNSGAGDPMVAAYLAGQIGSGVVAVRIDRPGMAPMWASVASGWFGAWTPAAWPNGTKVVGLDAAGTWVAEVSL